jgi:hypothetical protein
MKATVISTLLSLFVALPALAGQAQFHTARYALAESCQFSCAVGGGVTAQAAKKACQKVQGSARLFVARDSKSVVISNTDPRGNRNVSRYAFGKHAGPADMPSLRMSDQYALSTTTFADLFDSSYADGTLSKTLVRFDVLSDGSIRKTETIAVSGKFLGIASGSMRSSKTCRYIENR